MTTYIESKLNPDGTHDHSEVIEAHKKGAKVEYLHDNLVADLWQPAETAFLNLYTKYRAVIEDKPSYPQFFKQDSERFHNRLHEENRMEAVAVIGDKSSEKELEEEFWDVLEEQGRMWDMQAATLKLIQEKFKAPTESITLTRAEVNEVFPGLLK